MSRMPSQTPLSQLTFSDWPIRGPDPLKRTFFQTLSDRSNRKLVEGGFQKPFHVEGLGLGRLRPFALLPVHGISPVAKVHATAPFARERLLLFQCSRRDMKTCRSSSVRSFRSNLRNRRPMCVRTVGSAICSSRAICAGGRSTPLQRPTPLVCSLPSLVLQR